MERLAPDTAESALDTARVIVAAGRGVGGPENMEVIFATAALFGRSAVAGSRPVCDAGWLPVAAQVGVTGRTVSPALYLACGISGAFQHLAAISGARCVVAVNCDGRAPIFSRADFGIVERLESFLPTFAELCQKK
jgi:electron transfer flavoprotein alpha subunit